MELMAIGKTWDLAIVDPPYGLGIDGQKLNNKNKNPKHNRKEHSFKNWDSAIPNKIYFDTIKQKTTNQIIWGGNYFTDFLKPTKAWIFWYKGQKDLTMSDGELAWTSFQKVTRMYEINRCELIKQNTIHPTEKPIDLYRWILQKYAKKGESVVDTHGGSMSSAIACDMEGFELDICELDKEYFDMAVNRFKNYELQQTLFPIE
jgi:site-specific DNA-methyltransferase (adenine-specific)